MNVHVIRVGRGSLRVRSEVERRGPAGAADEHALVADKRARELEGLRIVDLAPVVDALLVQHGRDEVVPLDNK